MLRRYLPAATTSYFSNLALFVRRQCLNMNEHLRCGAYVSLCRIIVTVLSSESYAKLGAYFEEVLDNLYYIQDVLNVKVDPMNSQICLLLFEKYLLPQVTVSLIPDSFIEVQSIFWHM